MANRRTTANGKKTVPPHSSANGYAQQPPDPSGKESKHDEMIHFVLESIKSTGCTISVSPSRSSNSAQAASPEKRKPLPVTISISDTSPSASQERQDGESMSDSSSVGIRKRKGPSLKAEAVLVKEEPPVVVGKGLKRQADGSAKQAASSAQSKVSEKKKR